MARAQNSRHTPRFYIEFTFFDELSNLRLEYEFLKRFKENPTNAEVARKYFGEENVNRTMTILTSLAVRLPRNLIDDIGNIMNSEHPDLFIENSSLDDGGAKTIDEVKRTVDCRLYRKFIRLSSIYQSTADMNPKNSLEVQPQINTLHRLKYYCFLNGFKTDPASHCYKTIQIGC